MRLAVNGEEREVDAPITVATLLESLGVPPGGVAVAVNRRLVSAPERATSTLEEGDEVEIVQAAPGG